MQEGKKTQDYGAEDSPNNPQENIYRVKMSAHQPRC